MTAIVNLDPASGLIRIPASAGMTTRGKPLGIRPKRESTERPAGKYPCLPFFFTPAPNYGMDNLWYYIRPGIIINRFFGKIGSNLERADISVEALLPHRGRMRLVDEIIELDEDRAVTLSTVTEHWPFFDGKAVNALVLIELVAQTAGISNSWGAIKRQGDQFERRGWLVGIKRSRFLTGSVPLNTCLATRCENQFKLDKYREIVGTVRIDWDVVAEVSLQLIQPDPA